MLLNTLSIADVALCCAIFGTIIFLIKTFLPVDFGAEVSADFNVVSDTDASFNIFTIESISAFFMCSGWSAWLCLNQFNYSVKLSALIAIVTGLIGMFLFVFLIAKLKKLEHIPKADMQELVGRTGKAYMNFSSKGSSKIQIEYNSQLEILDAINDSEEEINAFENIKVTKVENNQIYIVKGV